MHQFSFETCIADYRVRVLHRRPEVFGSDALTFRPERWLDSPSAVLKEMKATMFQFGAGARVRRCYT